MSDPDYFYLSVFNPVGNSVFIHLKCMIAAIIAFFILINGVNVVVVDKKLNPRKYAFFTFVRYKKFVMFENQSQR